MSKYIVIYSGYNIPSGYETYSILLIPDWEWLKKVGDKNIYKLFNQFKKFGDTIGPNHLAAWLYRARIPKQDLIDKADLEIMTVVSNYVESKNDIYESIVKQHPGTHMYLSDSQTREVNAMDFSGGDYDVFRAQHFCANLNLSFNLGPYVAFFEEKPNIPTITGKYNGEVQWSSDSYTKPSFVLQFSALNFDQISFLLNELGLQLIREDVKTRKLKMDQLKFNIENWCVQNAGRMSKAVTVIKDLSGPVSGIVRP